MSEDKDKFDPELVATIRKQVLEEVLAGLRDEENKKKEEERLRREKAEADHTSYTDAMKESKNGWFEMIGEVENTSKGIRVELDWNEEIISYLRANGYNGPDDESIVQRYLAEVGAKVAADMAGDENENT